MNIRARPYRDYTDLLRMQHLVMVGRQATIPASYMHPGSLAWATHAPPADQDMRHNLSSPLKKGQEQRFTAMLRPITAGFERADWRQTKAE